jgi:hypothetical protein
MVKIIFSNDEINKILLEAQIYRLQDENKLETLKLYLEENFKENFVNNNEFHVDNLDHQQKKQLLEYLENI